MDLSQYKGLFLSEARERLEVLEKSLVLFEKNPHDAECLDEIFRQAHTLKGMFATMGYEEVVKLTHEMEGLFDLLRRGKLEVDKNAVALLFESLDMLKRFVAQIAAGQTKKMEPKAEAIADKLDQLKSAPKKEEIASQKERRSNLRLENTDRLEIVERAKEGFKAYRVTVSLKKECPDKTPRAFVVVRELTNLGKVIRSEFIGKQLERAKFGRHFGLFYLTKEPSKNIKDRIEKIEDVENVTLRPLEVDEMLFKKPPEVVASAKKEHGSWEALTIRVSMDRLDHLMNVVGELAINKIRLNSIAQVLNSKPLNEMLAQTDRLTGELQAEMMQVLLVPLDYIFNQFPRMVRDLAAKEGKEVDLVMEGTEIGLDRTILDEINDPLIHILRNAVSHGIEPVEERQKLGKERRGQIHLAARRERSFVIIEVSDDGHGMDADKIKREAVEQKVVTKEEADGLKKEDILMLVTSPGFSTSAVLSETSGRGMGMNAVRKIVESFGGSLKIESRAGAGSTFVLKLPLTMAIVQALLVRIGDETHAIPMGNIVENIKVKPEIIKQVEHHELIPYRDEVLPLIRMRQFLGFPDAETVAETEAEKKKDIPVVVAEMNNRKAGLVVDGLLGQQEIVLKTLKGILKTVKGLTGATILGDGKVAMVVDLAAIL